MTVRKESESYRGKSPALAALFQGIPLLGAAGCIANGASDQQLSPLVALLALSFLFWGYGYLYAGRTARYLVAHLGGPVLFIVSCAAAFSGVSLDYEHGPYDPEEVSAANTASVTEGLIIASVVLFMIVDVWRLTSRPAVGVMGASDGTRRGTWSPAPAARRFRRRVPTAQGRGHLQSVTSRGPPS